MLKKIIFIFIIFAWSCGQDSVLTEPPQSVNFIQIEPEERWINLLNRDKNGYTYGKSTLALLEGTYEVDWVIYQDTISSATLSIPSDWEVKPQSKASFYSRLDKNNSGFFIWKTFSKEEYELNLDELHELYMDIIQKDTVETASDLKVKQYNFDNKRKAYYLTAQLSDSATLYDVHSFLTEDANNFYEFSHSR
ncbi:MAG: hypothetical protein AAGI23_03855 [Bacteroidota bacterium]